MNKQIIEKVAKDLNLDEEIVDKVYKAYWTFIRTKISELPLKKDLTKEQFESINTNFNIPSLGKLNCTYDKYLRIKNTIKNAKNK